MTSTQAFEPGLPLLEVSRLTRAEIDVLMVAVARSLEPDTDAQDAWQASSVVWKHGSKAGPVLCSLATMFAEVRGPS